MDYTTLELIPKACNVWPLGKDCQRDSEQWLYHGSHFEVIQHSCPVHQDMAMVFKFSRLVAWNVFAKFYLPLTSTLLPVAAHNFCVEVHELL